MDQSEVKTCTRLPLPHRSTTRRISIAAPIIIAPDCAGQNFYAIDRGLRDLLQLYLEPNDFRRLEPHFDRLGALAGGRLDELARAADKHPPVLNARDRFGRDEDWIDYHSSYREMETIAFGDFQFHAMSHRAGALGMDRPLPAVAKYALQYLFVQAEFGLMCPISVTDTSIHLIRKFASAELQDYLLPKMLSGDVATMWKGTQFMTERAGGSDVGAIETIARCEDGVWRLYGDKWFCSHADADVALLLARPEGRACRHRGPRAVCAAAPAEGRPPQRLPHRPPQGQTGHPLDGERRDPARGRRRLSGRRCRARPQADDGAGQPVAAVARRSRRGDDAALRQRGDGVRAHAEWRSARPSSNIPCCAASFSRSRVPAEQSLSMFLFAASAMDRANAGSKEAEASCAF